MVRWNFRDTLLLHLIGSTWEMQWQRASPAVKTYVCMHVCVCKTWFSAQNVRVIFADRSRYGNDGPTRASWKKWMVARMNECGDVNAQVNAEKCTGNDSKRQDAFARFRFFHGKDRKEDECWWRRHDYGQFFTSAARRGAACRKSVMSEDNGARNTYFKHEEKKKENNYDETRVS